MFGKKDDIKALMKKAEKTNKKKKSEEEKAPLTPEEQLQRMVYLVLGVSGGITFLFASINILSIYKYNPSDYSNVDTSRIDTIKNFITTESTEKYKDLINKHNNEEQNNKLDIQTVHSAVTREYPFANILNRTQDTISTKLCKFIYTELKPAVISYKMANGVYPLKENEEEDNDSNIIDLDLLKELINVKDTSLKTYSYVLTGISESTFKITVMEGENVVPIILFDPTLFSIKEINKNEVNLVLGKYSIILKPMEEYNNIRLKSIDIRGNSKSCTLVDTITNKVVKISVG